MLAAGMSPDAIVAAVSAMEAATMPPEPILTARQARNKRYYEKLASEKRLKASETDLKRLNLDKGSIPPCSPLNGFPHPSFNPPIIPPTPKTQALPAWLPEKAFQDFAEHRRKIRKAMTKRAAELIIIELDKLMKRGHDPTAVLEQSIRNGWQDVFEIKEKSGSYNNAKPSEPKKSNVITL